jgi:hypothetical protein
MTVPPTRTSVARIVHELLVPCPGQRPWSVHPPHPVPCHQHHSVQDLLHKRHAAPDGPEVGALRVCGRAGVSIGAPLYLSIYHHVRGPGPAHGEHPCGKQQSATNLLPQAEGEQVHQVVIKGVCDRVHGAC